MNFKSSTFPEDRPNATWFLQDQNTFVYFLRELTGIGTAFYGTYFIIAWFLDSELHFLEAPFFLFFSAVAWICSVFHSITWFGVTLHVLPIHLPRWLERLGFFILLLAWGFISYFLFLFFYV